MIEEAYTRPMRSRSIVQLVGVCLAGALLACDAPRQPQSEPFILIAHAGGVAQSRTYSNSLEALDDSVARGFSYVELDFSWTSDERLVLLHDWDREFGRLFDHEPGRLTLAEFRSAKSRFGLTHLALEDLGPWMDRNPGISVITDIKNRNIDGLRRVAERLPGHRSRIVPQIHFPEEYNPTLDLGFEEIILTLYVSKLPDDEVVSFAAANRLTAVTMPVRRAVGSDLAARLSGVGVRVLVYTINDHSVATGIADAGVDGIYTDWLSPKAFGPTGSQPG